MSATIVVDGDLSGFEHEFALANQFANARVKDLARNAKKELDGVSKAAGQSASAIGRKAAALIGGPATAALDAIEVATATLGPLGVASLAAAAALGGVAVGLYAAGEAALAAEERLQAAGLAAMLDPEAAQSVDAYREAQAALGHQIDLVVVNLSAHLTPALTEVTTAMTGAVDVLGRATDAYLDGGEAGRSYVGTVASLAKETAKGTNLGAAAALAWDTLAGAWEVASDRGETLAEIQQNTAKGAKFVADFSKMAEGAIAGRAAAEETLNAQATAERDRAKADAARDFAAAQRELEAAQREVNAGLKAEAAARAALAELVAAATSDQLTGAARIEAEHAERLDRIAELTRVTEDFGGAWEAVDAAGARRSRDLAALQAAQALQWSAVTQEAASDVATAQRQVEDAYRDRVRAIQDLLEETGDADAAAAAMTAAQARRERDLTAITVEENEKRAEAAAAALGSIADAFGTIAALSETLGGQEAARLQGEVEARRAEREEWARGEQARIDKMVEVGALSEEQAAARRRQIAGEVNARARADHQLDERAREQAKAAFERTQALQIAAATIEGIRSGIALVPSFAYLGPFAPAAAAAVAGIATTTAIAQIAATEPPSFEEGGIVGGGPRGSTSDHVLTQAQPGEGYLTRRGVRAAGGPEGLERLNRGQSAGGGPVHVHLNVDGRELAEGRVDPLGSLRRGSRPRGRRALHG